MHDDDQEHEMDMQSSINLADPMSREASGTAWLPDSSSMYGRMFMLGAIWSCCTARFSRVTPM